MWAITAHDQHMGRHADHNTATIDRIRSLPLFSICRRRELATIAGNMTTAAVHRGTELTRQGDRGDQFYVLLSGSVDVIVHGEWVRSLDRGDFFGELALLKRQPRSATVVANSDVSLLVSHQTEFATMVALAPNFARSVAEGAAHRR